MAHTGVGLRERRTRDDMLSAKVPVSKIAVKIGRHRSIVFREIKRNTFVDKELLKLNGEYGINAQRSAVHRRARRRKLVRFVDLRQHVIAQLKVDWALEQIAGRLQPDGQPLRVRKVKPASWLSKSAYALIARSLQPDPISQPAYAATLKAALFSV